jgi:hypothetical protein
MSYKVIEIQKSQPHPRIYIRQKVKEILIDNTDLSGRWFRSKPNPLWLEQVPCGLIYFQDEPADHENSAPRIYKRTLTLVTDIIHREESDRDEALDDYLDSRAFEVEAALLINKTLGLGELIEDLTLTRSIPVVMSSQGNKDAGALRLFWDIIYRTGPYSSSGFDEFLRFVNKINTTIGSKLEDDVTIREA